MTLLELLLNTTHSTIVRIMTQPPAQAALCSESWLTGFQASTCNCFPLSLLQLCLWGFIVDTMLHGLFHPLHCHAFVIHLQLAGVLLMLQRQKQQLKGARATCVLGHEKDKTTLPHKQKTQRQILQLCSATNTAHLSRGYRNAIWEAFKRAVWKLLNPEEGHCNCKTAN